MVSGPVAKDSHWRTTPAKYAGSVEMVPRDASMCLPMNVAAGRGSNWDLWLMRKPAAWSEDVARDMVEDRADGEDEISAASSRYCSVSVGGPMGASEWGQVSMDNQLCKAWGMGPAKGDPQ